MRCKDKAFILFLQIFFLFFFRITDFFAKAGVSRTENNISLLIIWVFQKKMISLPALRESFKDITVMRAKQEIFISEAKKLQDYLVVPNNLLLSLSLSLEIQACSHFSFFLIAYAREAGRANPIGKGLS